MSTITNRLIHETSPYLRQHAHNPVDWHAWNDEALAKARTENKPILLSIGYSACHWCHVMERESFENPEIAKLMNENYINIKVDREERPDLDQIYQNVAQLMTRSGGWPLTVFLTPDLRPFFGGTYFPPDDRYGRPGFPRLLQALSQAYKTDPQSIEHNASQLLAGIKQLESISTPELNERASKESLVKIADAMLDEIDWRNGGIGDAPKFPNSMTLSYLWRLGNLIEYGKAKDAAVLSLTKMAQGGIFDQLGGGFHRYSVDAHWSVPHFEKMLYDNALLIQLYSEVLNSDWDGVLTANDRALFTETVRKTASYLLREMQSPQGGYFSTQDADSEGEEGKFFAWDENELSAILTPEELSVFLLFYGVEKGGNFEHGKTVLYQAMPLDAVAHRLSLPLAEVKTLLASASEKTFTAREKRIKPFRDEKELSGWNGLMISGMVYTAKALQTVDPALSKQCLASAQSAFQAVLKNLAKQDNRLLSVYKDGIAKINGFLDDYAFLAKAALDLFEATHEDSYLKQATGWCEILLQQFKDQEAPGFFFTSNDHEKLIQRPKTLYDQAIPSGTAVAIHCLYLISQIDPEKTAWEKTVDQELFQLFALLKKAPLGLGELANVTLLFTVGVHTVESPTSLQTSSPFVFQKGKAEKAVVCHRHACMEFTAESGLFNKIKGGLPLA